MIDGQFKRKTVLAISAAAFAGGILALSSTAALAGSGYGNNNSGHHQGYGKGHDNDGRGHDKKHGRGHDKKRGRGHDKDRDHGHENGYEHGNGHHGHGNGYGNGHHGHGNGYGYGHGDDTVKVEICHAKSDGSYKLIDVPEDWVAAHLAHGDPAEWTDLGDNSCEPYEDTPIPSDPVNYCLIITVDSLPASMASLFPVKSQVTYDPADGTITDITGAAAVDKHNVIGSTPANGIVASLIADSVSLTIDVERLTQSYPNLLGEAVSTGVSGDTATYSMNYIGEAISDDEESEGDFVYFNGTASMTISESLQGCLTTE